MMLLKQGAARASRCRQRLGLCLATTILCSGLAAPAFAQTIAQLPPPPVRVTTDQNSVDIIRGTFYPPSQDIVSIGPDGRHGLSFDRIGAAGGINSLLSAIENVGGKIVVTIGTHSDSFTQSGSNYVATEGNGATLVNASGTFIYTARDGTEARFASNQGFTYQFYENDLARPGSIKYPDGTLVEFTIKTQTYCPDGYGDPPQSLCNGTIYYVSRVQSVNNSNGYQLKPVYASNSNKLDATNYADWGRVVDVIGINNAVEYCSRSADSCTLANTWPKQSTSVVPPLRVTTSNDANGRVGTAVNRGVSYSYTYADTGSTRTTTVTGPSGSKVWTGDTTTFLISAVKDELNRTTSYAYDGNGRVTQIIYPEGNKVQYTYDARGNVTQTRAISKTPGTPPDIVTSASYDASCANPKTCNQPNTTTDAKGNITDYAYDATHGGVTVVTAPAAVVGGIRPQTRLSYASKFAYYKLSSTSIVPAQTPIYELTAISSCQTTASCAGMADEVKTTVDYGPQVAGTANNLLPIGISRGSGNGSLTATTTVTYDSIGNKTAVDGPLPGAADTAVARYNIARQLVGIISPDPDGVGALKNRAQRFTYNGDWQVTLAEVGTTAGQTDTAWAGFTVLQQAVSTYDANARKVSDAVQSSSGTTFSLVQYSYDAKGRLNCTAQRMDPAQWSGQNNACVPQTTGPNGPDRVTTQSYTLADEPQQTITASGTADSANEVYRTYTANGKPEFLIDGNNNYTYFQYDGFDRLSAVRMPSPTTPGDVNLSDYEAYTYDPNSNVTQRRVRDGQVIGYSYDNLNRVTAKTVPGGVHWDVSIAYAYDLMGRLTTLSNAPGDVMTMTYDALGRQTAETTSWAGTTGYAYDLAGRMTRLTWFDGFYAQYDRLVTGEVSAIRENGAASGVGVLGTYAYDDLGRLTTVTRGNGVVTNYGFDAVSRLASLGHDLAGTAQDVTTTFAYNPASQIASSTRSNDSYAWTGHYNVNRPYSVNGLNQLTAAGAVALGYDGRGNLTASGTTTYQYTVENRLATVSNGTKLRYDPAGRLFHVEGSSPYYLDSMGDSIITERAPGGAIQRRYVHGPGDDAPLVWYEGAGTTDKRWLIPDERGSIVAVTNASGAAIAVNSYDEYGIPASTNLGRFQYTGQAWVPELGMYDYKARIYSPTLGRFMQTDPIGYGDGMNWYNYVGSDPVNFSDPLGLASIPDPVVKPLDPAPPYDDIVVNGHRDPCPITSLCGNAARQLLEEVRQLEQIGNIVEIVDGEAEIIATGQRPQSNQCPAIPRVGPGKGTLDKNIRDARNDRPSTRAGRQNGGMLNLIRLSLRVTGDQNYKKDPRYGDAGANYGNFNFGATMQARGFSLDDALGYSNSFQLMTTDRYDPPEDIADVTNGYNYAARGCDGK